MARWLSSITVAILVITLIVACGGQSSPTTSPVASPPVKASAPSSPASASASPTARSEWDTVVEQARKEGRVTIYGSWNDVSAKPITDAFAKAYPGIALNYVALTGAEGLPRLDAEQSTGKYAVDLYVSGSPATRLLPPKGYVEIWQPPALKEPGAQFLFDPAVDGDGPIILRVSMAVIVVNNNLVPPGQEPKSWKDLADPKWKGKILVYDPASSGPGNVWYASAIPVYGEEYVRKVIDNSVIYKGDFTGLVTDVARGEYAMAGPISPANFVTLINQGAPVRIVVPSDGVLAIPAQTALVKHAPHPNAAKLLFNFLFSKEGQTAVAQTGETPVRTDVDPMVRELKGAKLFPGSPATKESDARTLPEARTAAQKMIQGLGK